MKRALFFLTSLLVVNLAAQEPASHADGSYAFGVQFAGQFTEGEVSVEDFLAGFRDKATGKELRVPEEKIESLFREFQKGVQEKRRAKELEPAETYLKENGAKEGVKTTASGLQYEVIKEGDGATPGPTDNVSVHYHGTLIDGTVFDSSVDRGNPASFGVGGVIKGWTEGLQLMKVGSKYRFHIHPDLAYGPRPRPNIPAHSALVFEVELLEVTPSAKPKPASAVTKPVPIPPRPKPKQ